jgi:hypothetical protein
MNHETDRTIEDVFPRMVIQINKAAVKIDEGAGRRFTSH